MDLKAKKKIALWLERHGDIVLKNAPQWFPRGLSGNYDLFTVLNVRQTSWGERITSEDDIFTLTEQNREQLSALKAGYYKELREWITTGTSIAAIIISIVALILAA